MLKYTFSELLIFVKVFGSANFFVLGGHISNAGDMFRENQVKLSLNSSPVIFGNIVELACTTESNLTNELQITWTVKENDANLCVNGDCSNPKKYSVFQKDAYTYILRINNFSMNDVNKWYRCFVGNVSDEIPIYLDDQNFEYHPNESEITVNTERKDGYLNVEIVIEQVFPYPVCTFKFDGLDVSSAVTTSNWHNGLFYSIEFVIKDYFVGYTSATLNVSCKIGKNDIHVVSQDFHKSVNSEPMSDEANSEINLIVVAVIANSLLILTGVVLFMCAESHCTKCCKRKTPDNRYHEFENNYSTSPL
ncbi:Hypothetical predicted protein [Mytilus galloprovincialis]|uniref:Ig-like domain-containing protein n=1 Tax=Mytilus galloprovincialis TaxID=29158 RepID=A0A8B6C5N7_MYTGA|nr:Hypothetical predicted protein [Mytilus galloprovincialis]